MTETLQAPVPLAVLDIAAQLGGRFAKAVAAGAAAVELAKALAGHLPRPRSR